MRTQVKKCVVCAASVAVAAVLSAPVLSAPPADWSNVATKTIKLFYPGQSTYQWLRSPKHKRAYRKTIEGDSCISCHEGEEEEIGNKIVAGKLLEPAKLAGKQGVIDLKVQAAYDDKNLYWRFQWKTRNNFPGRAHPQLRFDGKQWKQYGYPRLDKRVQSGEQPAIYEDRLAIMLDDGSVPVFKEQGCWLSCHTSERNMPDVVAKAQVKAHPYLGKLLKKKDVRKYLPASRSDDVPSWDKVKYPEEIVKIKAAGGFVDLMQWRAHRSNPVDMADDGYVLEYRLFDSGKKMFSKNVNKKTKQPKYMYDKSKVGVKSVTAETLRDPSMPYALVVGENAVAFDPNAGWKKGDMVPEYYLDRAAAKGSAADNNNAKGVWKDGMWTVVWTRPLDTGHPQDDKILKKGGVYTVGFAVHDDNITTRGHHVSFPLSLGIGAKADIEPVKVR